MDLLICWCWGCLSCDAGTAALRHAGKPLLRQAFVSHTGQDRQGGRSSATFAAGLVVQLKQQHGVDVFVDYDSLKPGADWSQEIEQHAELSGVMVVVLSPSYFIRYWCMRELDLALASKQDRDKRAQGRREQGITIIPVYYGIGSPNDLAVKEKWRQAWTRMAADGKAGVDEARWAGNLGELAEHSQGLLLSSFVGKDAEVKLQKEVAGRVAELLPPPVLLERDHELLGREAELVQLAGALVAHRLVVITGGAGEGKSRLAQELVAELQDRRLLIKYVSVDLGMFASSTAVLPP